MPSSPPQSTSLPKKSIPRFGSAYQSRLMSIDAPRDSRGPFPGIAESGQHVVADDVTTASHHDSLEVPHASIRVGPDHLAALEDVVADGEVAIAVASNRRSSPSSPAALMPLMTRVTTVRRMTTPSASITRMPQTLPATVSPSTVTYEPRMVRPARAPGALDHDPLRILSRAGRSGSRAFRSARSSPAPRTGPAPA